MAYKTSIAWETMRVFNSASLTGGYDAIGTALAYPAYKVKMVNMSDTTVTVSIDGANDIDVCPTLGFWLYDEMVTVQHEGLPKGTQFYVKAAAPGTGNIYLVVQYLKTS